jgi:hypothetical protein
MEEMNLALANADEKIVVDFVRAFAMANEKKMRELLAQDLESYVTNAQGGVDKLVGQEAYIKRFQGLDILSAKEKISITQLLSIKESQVLAMVEVQAQRGERKLHNFAALLFNIQKGQIKEMWMVEALPAESDTFWKS